MTPRRLKTSTACALLATMLLGSTLARGATYHVSPFGSDTPPYDTYAKAANHPWAAIRLATDSSDTVLIHTGSYQIDTTIDVARGVTIVGDGADSTILVWYGSYERGNWMFFALGDNAFRRIQVIEDRQAHGYEPTAILSSTIRVRSLLVDNCRFDGMDLALSGAGVLEIAHSYFYLRSATGCVIFGAGGQVLIHDNTFFAGVRFEAGGSRGVVVEDGPTIVENNVFDFSQSGHRGIPIEVVQAFRPVVVRNNLLLGGFMPLVWANGSGAFENNTVVGPNYNPPDVGPAFYLDGTHSIEILNNLWLANTDIVQFGNECDDCPPTSGFTFHYNAFWPPVDSFVSYAYGIIPIDVYVDTLANFNAFPMVTDSTYRLQYGSPLIDAGDPSILDADGSRSDIGWTGGPGGITYEYQDLPPTPPDTVIAIGETTHVFIHWSHAYETDLQGYRLYRGLNPGFWHPGLEVTAVLSPADTSWADVLSATEDSVFYIVTAIDQARQESTPSIEARYVVAEHPANRPLVIAEIPPQTVVAGDTLILTILASDPDGDAITLTVLNLPALNAAFIDYRNGSGLFAFTPDTSQVGDHSVQVVASDGEFADTLEFTIHVRDTTQLGESQGIVKVYPNPLNGSGSVEVDVPGQPGTTHIVKLVLHDLLGRTVATCFDGSLTSGVHTLALDLSESGIGLKLATGIYLLRMQDQSGTIGKIYKIAVVR